MGDHSRRFQGKKNEIPQQNDATSSSPREASHRTPYDFTNRPPGTGGNPSDRLLRLRRNIIPLAETSLPSGSDQPQTNPLAQTIEHRKKQALQNKRRRPSSASSNMVASEHAETQKKDTKRRHSTKTRITYGADSTTLHPSQYAYDHGVRTTKLYLPPSSQNLDHIPAKSPLEQIKFFSTTEQGPSESLVEMPSENRADDNQNQYRQSDNGRFVTSRHQKGFTVSYDKQTNHFTVTDQQGNTLPIYDEQSNQLNRGHYVSQFSVTYESASQSVVVSDHHYQNTDWVHEIAQIDQITGQTEQAPSPKTTGKTPPITEMLLPSPLSPSDDPHHSLSFTRLLQDDSLLDSLIHMLNTPQHESTHLQTLDASDVLETQHIERDRTNDRPSGPSLPPLEHESYYHHLIPTNGDRNQCAVEAITIARGTLPLNSLFEETVEAIEHELQQEQIRDLGEMINFGDEDGTATMAYLRSTSFLDDTRPIEVYSRHPQTGQLRHIRIGEGPGEPYRVFYQHETLHYWGLPQRPLENPFASDTQSSARLTSEIARLGFAPENARSYVSSESQHKGDSLSLSTAQETISVSRHNPYDVSITDLEHFANALPLGWTNPKIGTTKRRKKMASSSTTNPFTDQAHPKKQPNKQRKQQNQFPSTQETAPRANDSQRTESGKIRENHPFSGGSTDPEVIQQLTEMFIDTATNQTKNQGLTLTDEQYEETKDVLDILKENEFISKGVRRKAAQAAYKRSNRGKAAQAAADAKYQRSDKGKAAHAAYKRSDKGKAVRTAADAKYQQSAKGKAVRTARNERNSLLKNPEGRKQLVKERFLYEQGYLEMPEYIRHQYYDTFWEKNQHKLIEEEKELLGTDESKQKIIDEFIENSKEDSEQEPE